MIDADHPDEIVDTIDHNKHKDTIIDNNKHKDTYDTNHIQQYVMNYIMS